MPPWDRKLHVFGLYRAGMDLSLGSTRARVCVDQGRHDLGRRLRPLLAGVVAADQGRWGDHEAVLGRAHGEVRRRRAVGDTTAARMFDGVARALQGYALWKRGQPAEALPQLEAVQRDMRGSAGEFWAEENLNDAVRWWLGQLLVELDRPRDALVYFQTATGGGWRPFQEFESAKIYEELGEFEGAGVLRVRPVGLARRRPGAPTADRGRARGAGPTAEAAPPRSSRPLGLGAYRAWASRAQNRSSIPSRT